MKFSFECELINYLFFLIISLLEFHIFSWPWNLFCLLQYLLDCITLRLIKNIGLVAASKIEAVKTSTSLII